MNKKSEKVPVQTNKADNAPEQATTPCRSLADNKTWLELLDSIENMKYSTQSIFKVSGKNRIDTDPNIEPIFLYDNIILGMCGDRLVFLFDEKFEYVRNELFSEAINQKSYGFAKSVFGVCIAEHIFDELQKKYEKVFDDNEYCDLIQLTFLFKLCQLNDAVSQWVCSFINGQIGLGEAPAELRTTNFQLWESSQPLKNAFRYQSENDCFYSIGCFLENVLSGLPGQ